MFCSIWFGVCILKYKMKFKAYCFIILFCILEADLLLQIFQKWSRHQFHFKNGKSPGTTWETYQMSLATG